MNTRAKFKVTGVTASPTVGPTVQVDVYWRPVYSDDPTSENYSWAKWTPNGDLHLQITNPALFNVYEVGKEYFLDLTPVPVEG